LFKKIKLLYKINIIFIGLFLFILSCNLKPLYEEYNFEKTLCNIKVSQSKPESAHYEEIFKNEMENSLCAYANNSAKYVLQWNITKSKEELIGSDTNKTIRYQLKLSIEYALVNIINKKVLYKDTIYSSAEYNILEDEMLSTIASEQFNEAITAKNLTNIIKDKIYLFMVNNENSKL
tara:strand:- start:11513 stop:12043 length:531 start_codon:yes stop_codon:yes gene_type:complete